MIPLSLVPGIDAVDFSTMSLYEVLEDRYDLRPMRARFAVEAIAAGDRDAAALDLPPGGPLLRCEQLTENATGRVIESSEMRYRGDRYRFRATLVRAPAPTGGPDGEPPT